MHGYRALGQIEGMAKYIVHTLTEFLIELSILFLTFFCLPWLIDVILSLIEKGC